MKNVVAPQGTAFTAEQARLLRRFVEQVTLCFDSDTAGQNAVERSLPALLSAGISVKAARLPAGEDPDSLIRGKGVEAFQSRLAEARDFFDHTIERAVAESGDNFGPREKAAVARHLGAYLSLLPDAALRETTTAHVASTLGISVAALQEAAAKNPLTLAEESSQSAETSSAAKRPLKVSASTELICRLAIISPQVREWLSHQNSPRPEELDPELQLLNELLPPLKEVSDPSPSTFLALIPQELQSLISGWEFEKMPDSPLEAVQDAFRNLQLLDLKKRQNFAAIQLRSPGLSGEKMLSIQKEILDLQQKIKHLSAPATSALTSLR